MTPAYCNRSTISTQHGDHRDRQRPAWAGPAWAGSALYLTWRDKPAEGPAERQPCHRGHNRARSTGLGVVAPTAEGHPPAGRYRGGTRNGALESATRYNPRGRNSRPSTARSLTPTMTPRAVHMSSTVPQELTALSWQGKEKPVLRRDTRSCDVWWRRGRKIRLLQFPSVTRSQDR